MEKVTYEYNPNKHLKPLTEWGIGFEDTIAILDSEGAIYGIRYTQYRQIS